ncbi:MAG TPA: hypothetical protein VGE41_01430 [Verrucomicrobiae bacterium]
MVQPLALFLYEKLLPSGQLVNRFQDMGYRVQSVGNAGSLAEHAEREKPLLVVADLDSRQGNICDAIIKLRQNPTTAHIPVIAFAPAEQNALQESARQAGATLVVSDTAILHHLAQFVDQALEIH